MDGETGLQMGPVETGSRFNDFLGSGGITVLANGHYVISSPLEDALGRRNAGSVRLVNGESGELISVLVGEQEDNFLGSNVLGLLNGNYVIVSSSEDNGGLADTGSLRLMDGSTGAQIGETIFGDQEEDQLGSEKVLILANGNFLVASSSDDEAGVVNAGSVRLFDGNNGTQIGVPYFGEQPVQEVGSEAVVPLANSNYVVVSSDYDDPVAGTFDTGSVRLFDGNTAEQIGLAIIGDQDSDLLGIFGVQPLSSGNYVILSPFDDNGAVRNGGSVRLVNGSTGVEISTIFGNQPDDLLGERGVTELTNGNYVVSSPGSDEAIFQGGLVQLFDGTTGTEISSFSGDQENDQVGFPRVTALGNDNYVIASSFDNVGALVRAGSVRLFNGSNGEQIGPAFVGEKSDDFVGDPGAYALSDNSYLIVSSLVDVGLIESAGSARRFDGVTGIEMGSPVFGQSTLDFDEADVLQPDSGGYYLLLAPEWDNGATTDSGLVRLFGL